MKSAHVRCSFLIFFTLLFMAGCASLPPNSGNPKSYAFQDTLDTTLGKSSREIGKNHLGESGFLLLGNSLDAFTARVVLANQAGKSIDAQYYLFHNDLTGILFADRLIQAADRGVRVRLLIDDMDLGGRDVGLSTLATHPNIGVRVFNPFSRDTFRTPQFITRFGSVTRRMHNKSFTVDNVATIVGGRNIGDEYFGANPFFAFADLDLLAIGAVVPQVSASFDSYWNSELSYPITVLRPDLVESSDFGEGRKRLAAYLAQDSVKKYKQSLYNAKLAKDIRNHSVEYTWGEGVAVYDKPIKIEIDEEGGAHTLSYQVRHFFEGLNTELIIFTPYFVPGKEGTKKLSELSKSGVRVRILTNSLASTDVSVVHAGYAKYRKALLRSGVELYEMDKTSGKQTKKRKGAGSSTASLHAKSFVLDREHVFIGSLNFDPLSINENTEVGIMLSSTEVANTMVDVFNQVVEQMAFRLELKRDSEGYEFIYWHGQEEGEKHVWTADPHTGFWQRFGIFLMSLLPIESKL